MPSGGGCPPIGIGSCVAVNRSCMSIDDDVVLLERVPTLRLLGNAALRVLAIGSEQQEFARGSVLFRLGEEADCGYVVQRGSFRVSLDDGSDHEVIAGPGTLLGELALVVAMQRPSTAVAQEYSTVIRFARQHCGHRLHVRPIPQPIADADLVFQREDAGLGDPAAHLGQHHPVALGIKAVIAPRVLDRLKGDAAPPIASSTRMSSAVSPIAALSRATLPAPEHMVDETAQRAKTGEAEATLVKTSGS
eukprot:gene42082-56979_t